MSPGIVRPGTSSGASATPIASTASRTATPLVAIGFQGETFPAAITTTMTTIQAMLNYAEREQRRHQRPAAADGASARRSSNSFGDVAKM
jgi:hypothetical protein